jgi:hypothetical protein
VYVVPLQHVYSAMIYGRVGVMGWVDQRDLRQTYDAADPTGRALYQEWVQFKPGLFRLLTTTIHAQYANRQLRNAFRRRFHIDCVFFRPDEFNRAYVQPARDRWFVLSDFPARGWHAAGSVGFSRKVRDCELVAIGSEDFLTDNRGFVRHDQVGEHVTPRSVVRVASTRPSLAASLISTYQNNRSRGASPPQFLLLRP